MSLEATVWFEGMLYIRLQCLASTQSSKGENSHSHKDIFSKMEKSDMFWKYYDFFFFIALPRLEDVT